MKVTRRRGSKWWQRGATFVWQVRSGGTVRLSLGWYGLECELRGPSS